MDNLNPLDIADVMKDGGAVNIIQRPAMDKQLVETAGRYARPGRTMLLLPDELIPRQSEAFAVIERAIRNISATDVNAVIFGECGSGKEQIAKEIYRLSSRSQKPCTVFVPYLTKLCRIFPIIKYLSHPLSSIQRTYRIIDLLCN